MGEAHSFSPAGPWGFFSVRCVAAPPVTRARCLGRVFTGSVCLLPKAFDHNLHSPEGALSFTLPPAQLQVKPDPVGRNGATHFTARPNLSRGRQAWERHPPVWELSPQRTGDGSLFWCGTMASRGCQAQGRVSLPHTEAKGRRGHLGHTGLGLLPPPLQQVASLARKCWGTGGPVLFGRVRCILCLGEQELAPLGSTSLRTWHSVS